MVVLFVGKSGVWNWRATRSMFRNMLRCTGMETCEPVNSPMTAEDFKDDDRKKTEAQLKVLPHRKTVSPRHRARSQHVAGPSGPQCSSLSGRHEDAGTN